MCTTVIIIVFLYYYSNTVVKSFVIIFTISSVSVTIKTKKYFNKEFINFVIIKAPIKSIKFIINYFQFVFLNTSLRKFLFSKKWFLQVFQLLGRSLVSAGNHFIIMIISSSIINFYCFFSTNVVMLVTNTITGGIVFRFITIDHLLLKKKFIISMNFYNKKKF